MVTSSSASETIFALAAFTGFSSEVIVRRPALVPLESDCALLRLCLPNRARDLMALSYWHVAMASNMF